MRDGPSARARHSSRDTLPQNRYIPGAKKKGAPGGAPFLAFSMVGENKLSRHVS